MIRSFKNKDTERIYKQQYTKKIPPDIHKRALIKLMLIDAAEKESDLNSPPGNHFKQLGGNRKNEYSIRINDQWRICFKI